MYDLIRRVTIAGLLHDIGKILHRGSNGDGRSHSISGKEWVSKYTQDEGILEGIAYHHHQEIENAQIENDSIAYLVYIADNISSGADRREIEGEKVAGFSRGRPLESVYNLLNNANGKAKHHVAPISEKINYPVESYDEDTAYFYNRIIDGITEGLNGINFEEDYINSLLEITEAYLTYVPSSTYLGEVADISLFDHSRTTAAMAACIVHYLQAGNRSDYRLELFSKRKDFYQEKAFCMFSCDISGVQQFIYTISSKGALKGLRARSFYLELMLENLVDEILQDCSLYRTNLIYTGGAHAYILLPNTTEAITKAEQAVKNTNQQLMQLFGTRLFIAYGIQEFSADEIMGKTEDPEDYGNIFRSLSAQISERKLRRYNAEEIRLFNQESPDKEGRECKICGASSMLEVREEGTVFCSACAAFSDISGMLIKPDSVFAVTVQQMDEPVLPLFSSQGERQYFHALKEEKVKQILQQSPEQVVRIYSKNTFRTGLTLATKLWLGDYAAVNQSGELKTFGELAASSCGIDRIGVLRADVDNMGAAFVKGFIREAETGKDKYRYLTLSRSATLSRSLSIFFKYYINDLLANGESNILNSENPRNVVIVYSGGDDLFIVGAWNEVIAAALDIRKAFVQYTGQTLSISAGLAIFEDSYPIARMAAETEILETEAKNNRYPGGEKNSISLLGQELVQVRNAEDSHWEMKANHTYDWDTFENKVLGEKYQLIDKLFSASPDYGNSFLYAIVALLRCDEPGRINIARLAYLLARHEPVGNNVPEEIKSVYREFSQNIYKWAIVDEDRRQLLTALILYTYNNRKAEEEQ